MQTAIGCLLRCKQVGRQRGAEKLEKTFSGLLDHGLNQDRMWAPAASSTPSLKSSGPWAFHGGQPPVFPEHLGGCCAPKGLTYPGLFLLSPASNRATGASEGQRNPPPLRLLPSPTSARLRPQLLQAVRRQLWNQKDLCSPRVLPKSLRLPELLAAEG